MKKTFIVFVMIICILPSAAMLFMGESPPVANEVPVSKPKIINEDKAFNTKILSDITDYIGKGFSFRQELITLNSRIITKLFGVSPVNDVIFGKEGWFFYKSTMDDFLKKDVLTNEQIEKIADTLLEFEQKCNENGRKFLFVIAPNKNTVYPEFMPYLSENQSEKSNRENLFEQLRKKNISYIDLMTAFNSKKSLYHKKDSHWNNKGAALAADEVLKALNYNETPFFSENYTVTNDFDGDLYHMLFPKGSEKDENFEFSQEMSFTYDVPIRGADSMTIKTTCEGKNGSLLVFRDSFGNALYPFLAQSCNKAVFLRKTPYNPEILSEYEADTVIIVMAERNLYQFDKFVETNRKEERK